MKGSQMRETDSTCPVTQYEEVDPFACQDTDTRVVCVAIGRARCGRHWSLFVKDSLRLLSSILSRRLTIAPPLNPRKRWFVPGCSENHVWKKYKTYQSLWDGKGVHEDLATSSACNVWWIDIFLHKRWRTADSFPGQPYLISTGHRESGDCSVHGPHHSRFFNCHVNSYTKCNM